MNSQFWCFNNIILLSSSTAMFTILQTVIVCAISYALWKLRRRFFIKLALDNIPGPPPQSFLFGEFFLNPWPLKPPSCRLFDLQVFFHSFSTSKDGNFTNILNRNVSWWIFFNSLRAGCWRLADGSVIKIKAFLGVCAVLFRYFKLILIVAL